VEDIPIGGGSPQPYKVMISKYLRPFVTGVESIANSEGNLHGKYFVYITPIDNFTDVRDGIQERLLDYIRNTKNLQKYPRKVVFKSKVVIPSRMPECQIEKVDSKPDEVLCVPVGTGKWSGEVKEGLFYLLNDRLDTKVVKLQNIATPKILLLFDEYPFADLQDYRACITEIPLLSSFHTVFVVQDHMSSFLFYSQRSDWSTQQFIVTATN
jgi:hypothetical protein